VPVDDLLERLSRDLDMAFAEVIARHEPAVFTTAVRISGQPAEAEDLAAETFLRAYAALRTYPASRISELDLRPWLITICLNQWRNRLRAASRRPRETALEMTEPPAASAGPEEHAARRETQEQLQALLQQLPEKERIAVVLRHIVGCSTAEIARVLACPEGTAKSHVSRGLDRLRTLSEES
jgi:RNA polymerase sigma-70 factor (ECF subfamily)